MAELRMVAADNGLQRVSTYLASGNLLFESGEEEAALEPLLEEAIARRFGFQVDAIVRSAARWRGYARSNPFPEESARAPHLVMIAIGKQPAREEDIASLRLRAGLNERVERREDAIWIWYGDGAGRSKLGSGAPGGVWTTRNWRTVAALEQMLAP